MKTHLLAAVLIAIAAAPLKAQDAPTGSWLLRPPTVEGFTYGAWAGDGVFLYVWGGTYNYIQNVRVGRMNDGMRVHRYELLSGAWTVLPDLPEYTYGAAGVHLGDALYSFGNGSALTGTILRFDLILNTWTYSAASLTANRSDASAAVAGSRIFITGGWNEAGGGSSLVDEYDPTTDTIIPRAAMPVARYGHVSAGLPANGHLYVMGGGNDVEYLSSSLEYDPEADSWTSRAPMNDGAGSVTRTLASCFVLNNRIFLPGGSTQSGETMASLLEYSPFGDRWFRRADLNRARYSNAATASSLFGYVYGGWGEVVGVAESFEQYSPPDYGSVPSVANAQQSDSAGPVAAGAGTPDSSIRFSADVSDPDAGQAVRFEVEVKPAAAPTWAAATRISTPFQPQGTLSIDWAIPADGDYDWRYRVADDLDNFSPSAGGLPGWIDFDAGSPDFSSGSAAPPPPPPPPPTPPPSPTPSPAGGGGGGGGGGCGLVGWDALAALGVLALLRRTRRNERERLPS